MEDMVPESDEVLQERFQRAAAPLEEYLETLSEDEFEASLAEARKLRDQQIFTGDQRVITAMLNEQAAVHPAIRRCIPLPDMAVSEEEQITGFLLSSEGGPAYLVTVQSVMREELWAKYSKFLAPE